jgi:predicted outer membrane repeat protein
MGRKMAVVAAAGVTAVLAGRMMQPAAGATTVTSVRCKTSALVHALSGAASGATLNLAKGCTYVLTAALPTVAENLTINGNGATLLRSSAAGTADFTILGITAGTVTLNGLSFTNGSGAITVNNSAQLNVTGGEFHDNTAANGAAIYNADNTVVNVNGALFSNNTATSDGGAIYAYTARGDQITDSTFQGNTAADSGGAYWDWSIGDDAIGGSTFTGNTAATGGALYLSTLGSVLTGIVVQNNSATGDGGGIADGATPVAIVGSKITGNHAGGAGGGLDEEGSTSGPPAEISSTVIAGNSAADGGGISDGKLVEAKYTGDTISGNHAAGDGGGISIQGGEGYDASFADSAISGNHAGARGGGVYTKENLEASGTQITGNRALGGGGGIYSDGTEAMVTLTDSSPTRNQPDNCQPLGSITGCTG